MNGHQNEGKKGTRPIRTIIGGILLIFPFVIFPFVYWYIFHHAPDTMVTPTYGRAYQKLHLETVLTVAFFLLSIVFLLPGAIVTALGLFKRLVVRLLMSVVILVVSWFFLAIEGSFLFVNWPNPIFPKDALKVHREQQKAAEEPLQNDTNSKQ